MEKEKGCSTAYLDSSPTIITAFTELGGAEPLVEVLKGCEELSCSQYSALNNSTYPNTYSMVAYRQTTETRSRIGQTPNYSECLVRTHPSLTGPGMAGHPLYKVQLALALCSDTCHLRHNCTVRCRQDCFGCKSTCVNTCWRIQRYWDHSCIE